MRVGQALGAVPSEGSPTLEQELTSRHLSARAVWVWNMQHKDSHRHLFDATTLTCIQCHTQGPAPV